MDPLKRLTIQQQQEEAAVTSMTRLPHAGGKPDKERDYQGPMSEGAGVGTKDAMPGTTGYTYSTPNPVEMLLDKLRIRPYQRKKIKISPSYRPTERYPGVI